MKKGPAINLREAKQFVAEGGTESKLDVPTAEPPAEASAPVPPPSDPPIGGRLPKSKEAKLTIKPSLDARREELLESTLARLETADFGKGINLRFPSWLDRTLEDYVYKTNAESERTQKPGEKPRRLTKQYVLAEALINHLADRVEVFE